MIGYTTEAQRAADIARLERRIADDTAALADAKAAKVEPDVGDAVIAYLHAYNTETGEPDSVRRQAGLIAAYPALHKALGSPAGAYGKVHTDGSRSGGQPVAPEPTEAEDLAMAEEARMSVYRKGSQSDIEIALAAIKAERQRAGGGK
jgi:hypothetical protein